MGERSGPASAGSVAAVVRLACDGGVAAVRRYHRLSVRVEAPVPDQPSLIVGNHGFGGLVDLHVWAMLAALADAAPGRPLTIMTHQMAWTLRAGWLVEAVGGRPASREEALDGLARGHHVVVFPGGDLEAAKPWRERNRVLFYGRHGFADLAREFGVPLVPVVSAGAGESLLVLHDGQRAARALRVDRLLRCHVLPVSVSIPWGLNVGLVGLLPYLPLPTKLDTVVLPPVRPTTNETGAELALRVQETMQGRLVAMTAGRRPLLG